MRRKKSALLFCCGGCLPVVYFHYQGFGGLDRFVVLADHDQRSPILSGSETRLLVGRLFPGAFPRTK